MPAIIWLTTPLYNGLSIKPLISKRMDELTTLLRQLICDSAELFADGLKLRIRGAKALLKPEITEDPAPSQNRNPGLASPLPLPPALVSRI